MASDAEMDMVAKIMKKYGDKLRAEGLTTKTTGTGERPKIQKKDQDKLRSIIGKKMFDDYLQARTERRKGNVPSGIDFEIKSLNKADNKLTRIQREKDMGRESEIAGVLISKYPQLKEFMRANQLMVQKGKQEQIRGILKPADLKLYDDYLKARGQRLSGKPAMATGKVRQKGAAIRNRKTVPKKMARKELISGEKIGPGPLPAGKQYLKRNVRAGQKGAAMLGALDNLNYPGGSIHQYNNVISAIATQGFKNFKLPGQTHNLF
jgi:hypothetical protein